jgi:hypothetical protein
MGRQWEVFRDDAESRRPGLGRGRGRAPNTARRNQILEMKRQGFTAREIGASLNPPITKQAVRSMLTRLRRLTTTQQQEGE